jgi:DNA-binding MarR family transcriptional regulator/N-acetylglutamate synthase-like GNAT family acetyltransferase
MAALAFPQRVAAVRRFNRFYTKQIGLLHEHLLRSAFSLTEVRVLYELAHRRRPTATEIRAELGLDAGYLSRLVRGFEKRGLVRRARSPADRREHLLTLTPRGRGAFAPLEARSDAEIGALLRRSSPADQQALLRAIATIERLLGGARERPASYVLRSHRPGDIGWVVHRHGVLYAQEYGWDERFEALVAEIVARFVKRFDPRAEHCWIAEREGEIVGSVFLVRRSRTVAQLRLLLVEPSARGLGIGRRLVDECLRFAQRAGYKKIVLWTNDVLHAARHIYEATGFRLVHHYRHQSFGRQLVGQTWEKMLTTSMGGVEEKRPGRA